MTLCSESRIHVEAMPEKLRASKKHLEPRFTYYKKFSILFYLNKISIKQIDKNVVFLLYSVYIKRYFILTINIICLIFKLQFQLKN